MIMNSVKQDWFWLAVGVFNIVHLLENEIALRVTPDIIHCRYRYSRAVNSDILLHSQWLLELCCYRNITYTTRVQSCPVTWPWSWSLVFMSFIIFITVIMIMISCPSDPRLSRRVWTDPAFTAWVYSSSLSLSSSPATLALTVLDFCSVPQSFQSHSKTFHKLFPEIPEDLEHGEVQENSLYLWSKRVWRWSACVAVFTCALHKEVIYHGKMYVSRQHICFHSSVLLKDTKVRVCPQTSTSADEEQLTRSHENAHL